MSITPVPLDTPFDEEKGDIKHEIVADPKDAVEQIVADTEAAAYIDSTVVITPEENKRLVRKIYKQ